MDEDLPRRATAHSRTGGRKQRDERASVLTLSAVGMVLAMVTASLAIDLGSLSQLSREMQKVADHAALDAVRSLPDDPTPAAEASAARNGFDGAKPGAKLTVEWTAASPPT